MTYLNDQCLGVEYDTKYPIVITDGSTSNNKRNHCIARGWITRDTFLPDMQRTTLKVRMSNGKSLSDSTQLLQCALEEIGCETNSLDPYAYKWDYPDNCVLSILRTEDVNMVKQSISNFVSLVDPNQLVKLCSMLWTTLKNTGENQQISIRPITIHSMWQI